MLIDRTLNSAISNSIELAPESMYGAGLLALDIFWSLPIQFNELPIQTMPPYVSQAVDIILYSEGFPNPMGDMPIGQISMVLTGNDTWSSLYTDPAISVSSYWTHRLQIVRPVFWQGRSLGLGFIPNASASSDPTPAIRVRGSLILF